LLPSHPPGFLQRCGAAAVKAANLMGAAMFLTCEHTIEDPPFLRPSQLPALPATMKSQQWIERQTEPSCYLCQYFLITFNGTGRLTALNLASISRTPTICL